MNTWYIGLHYALLLQNKYFTFTYTTTHKSHSKYSVMKHYTVEYQLILENAGAISTDPDMTSQALLLVQPS